VAYSPLGRGFLTGAVKPAEEYPADDMRRRDERWQGENYAANVRGLEQLEELADLRGITLLQLALVWVLSEGDDLVPIPGTRNVKRLEENVAAAADLTLIPADLARIREIFPEGAFGARYAAEYQPTWE
jgi:aryl-alcohol dehydrogenase-like predicted oxidoreductase